MLLYNRGLCCTNSTMALYLSVLPQLLHPFLVFQTSLLHTLIILNEPACCLWLLIRGLTLSTIAFCNVFTVQGYWPCGLNLNSLKLKCDYVILWVSPTGELKSLIRKCNISACVLCQSFLFYLMSILQRRFYSMILNP